MQQIESVLSPEQKECVEFVVRETYASGITMQL